MNIPYYQMQILSKLLFKPNSRFTDLNLSGLSSDHLTYHIKALVKSDLIEKNSSNRYRLTVKGKEFANTMDTEKKRIEKQPKVTVMIIVEKQRKDGLTQLLIQKRLKEPFYGFQGFVTGKVAFGEPILDTAKRELFEETGLTADFEHIGICREFVYSIDEKLLEDKIFNIVIARKPSGSLSQFEGGKNFWVARDKFTDLDLLYYSEIDKFNYYCDSHRKFYAEHIYHTDDF